MKYERPAVLATYSVAELMEEAAVCQEYCDWDNKGGFKFWG